MRSLEQALEIVGQTDTGLFRDHNEDAISFKQDVGLVVLADGMGGYNAGEVASQLAVDTVINTVCEQMAVTAPHVKLPGNMWPQAHDMLLDSVERANRIIYMTAQQQVHCAGMGTTLIAALFYDNRLAVAHVGDSRVYRLRNGELMQISHDHSLLQEQIDAGLLSVEEARYAPYKNLVTRAVGIGPEVDTELMEHEVLPGDLYLFCSDGLNDMLEDEDITQLMFEHELDLAQMAAALVHAANLAGGRDNISVVLVRANYEFPASESIWSKVTAWFGSSEKET